MKEFRESFTEIRTKHRWLFVLMIGVFLISLALFIYSLVTLSPNLASVKNGYGDIGSYQGGDFSEMQLAGGYRDGSWLSMFSFTILAVIVGVMHNFIAVKLYKRRGRGIAEAFLAVSIGVLLCAFIVLMRLHGEV